MQTGTLLATFRKTQRLSQLDLATRADVSSRHISFIETGKSQPSAMMLQRLAQELGLDCRETNRLLLSAGYAPKFSETALTHPAMSPINDALHIMLNNHAPFPAVAMDAHWNLFIANQAQQQLAAKMIAMNGPFPDTRNQIELLFHPQGYRPFIHNWDEVAGFLLRRLIRDQHAQPNATRQALLHTLANFADLCALTQQTTQSGDISPMLTLDIRIEDQRLRLFSTIACFGTAMDVVAEEIRIEHYFPADAATREWFENQEKSATDTA